jgi:SAM-dependent methyltransferase
MDYASLENMNQCYLKYVTTREWKNEKITIYDIGGQNINGSYRDVFSCEMFDYIAVDIVSGEGVDLVLSDPYDYHYDIPDNSADIVVCGQAFEHIEFFWKTFHQIMKILKADGLFFLIAPSTGPIHRYPVDCYRFYPDAYKALAKNENCHLIECWMDEKPEWRHLVGVFSKTKFDRVEVAAKNEDSCWANKFAEITFSPEPKEERLVESLNCDGLRFKKKYSLKRIPKDYSKDITCIEKTKEGLLITSCGVDPYFSFPNINIKSKAIAVKLEMSVDTDTNCQLFFSDKNRVFNEDYSAKHDLEKGDNDILFIVKAPFNIISLRLDPGETKGVYVIKKLEVFI